MLEQAFLEYLRQLALLTDRQRTRLARALVGPEEAPLGSLLLGSKLAKHFSKMLAQLSVQRPAPALRDEYHVIFAVPRRVAQTFKLVHLVSSFHVLGGSRLEVSTMDKPEYVKLLLPPRQSRGNSFGC